MAIGNTSLMLLSINKQTVIMYDKLLHNDVPVYPVVSSTN